MSEVGVVRKRRSRAEAEALVAEFEASGLGREAFCRQRGLSIAALDKYRRLVHKSLHVGSGTLLPVEVVGSSPARSANSAGHVGLLVVELRSGQRVEVGRGFDAETLERLLSILDRS